MNQNLKRDKTPSRKIGTCLEVLDKELGHVLDSSEVLARGGEAWQFRERMKLEEQRTRGIPKYVCPLCGRNLSLRAGNDRMALHFAHPREPEHACPYKTGDKHSPEQLAAMKYNGLKETLTHRRLKAWTWQSLRADKSTQLGSVKTEARLKAKLPDAGYRIPDVRAIWKERTVVFEAQIASTFVTTIAQRRVFYQRYGANLLWLFPLWPEKLSRFTSKDIYYNNNFNVFVINEKTVKQSIESERMTLEVWWADPRKINDAEQPTVWLNRYATLDELTFDEIQQRVYLVDVERELKAHVDGLRNEQAKKRFASQLSRGVDDRVPPTSTLAFAFDGDPSTEKTEGTFYLSSAASNLFEVIQKDHQIEVKRQLEWFVCESSLLQPKDVLSAFVASNLLTPVSNSDVQAGSLATILTFLFSLEQGRAMPDHKWKNLKQLENLVFNSYRQHYRLFLSAAELWERGDILDSNNPKSTLMRHKKIFKQEMGESDHSPASLQDRSFDRAVLFVFPELQTKIERLSSLQASRPGSAGTLF